MTAESSALNRREIWMWRILWTLLGVLTIVISAIALNPVWRLQIQGWLQPEKRELLATVSGELLGDGKVFKVLKFATPHGLIIEVHRTTDDNAQPFVFLDRLFIPDRHDGFVTINSQATRLAIVDIDGDLVPEIIAPSFDDKLVAHLNTLHLNADTQRLELVKQRPKGAEAK